MNIIRLTRHEMSTEQAAELARVLPGAQAVMVSETLPTDPRQAVARFDEIAAGVDVVEAVLPISLLEAVLKFSNFSKRGGVIIRAVTKRNLSTDGQVSFDFEYYEKVLKVEVVVEHL